MNMREHVACNAGEARTRKSRRDQARKGGCKTGQTRTEGSCTGAAMGSKAAAGDEGTADAMEIGSTGSAVQTRARARPDKMGATWANWKQRAKAAKVFDLSDGPAP